MNTIFLYDMSAMVISGTNSNTGAINGKPRKEYNFYSYPTGGLYTFFERFITDYKSSKPGDVFVACFDGAFNKLKKKQVYPDYKGNRAIAGFDDNTSFDKRNPEQIAMILPTLPEETQAKVCRRAAAGIQLKTLRTLLPKVGINVLYDEELEADDWIYSVCYHFGQDFKIFLRADDGDLDDCAAYAPNITKWSVSGRKELKPEVGKNFMKIFHGETGDNIPCLTSRYDSKSIVALRDSIISGLEDISILDDPQALNERFYLSPKAIEDLSMNYFLVNPLIQSYLELNDEPLNADALATIFSAFRLKQNLSRIKKELVENEDVTNIQKFAFSLLPTYVRDFYKRKEFKDSAVSREMLEQARQNVETSEEYLIRAAAKYNIL